MVGFGVTYEGLKLLGLDLLLLKALGFGVTYEGLKHEARRRGKA